MADVTQRHQTVPNSRLKRPPTLDQIERAAALLHEDQRPDEEIAAELGICRRTLARWKHRPEIRAAYGNLVEQGRKASVATAAEWDEREKILDAGAVRPCARINAEKPLPKTGSVCMQWVRCGKPSCRCAGGELHGPYHYLFWREGGRLRKRYVKPADVAATRAACQGQRERRRHERQRRQDALQVYRDIMALVRGVEHGG